MKKNYILDTNILIQTHGAAISGFKDNIVIVTHTTLEELDHLKTSSGETGYAARESIRIINDICDSGDCLKGIKMKNGGTFKLESNGMEKNLLPVGWSLEKPDNRIICTTKYIAENSAKTAKTILVTNDVAMLIKAKAAGVMVEDYHNDRVETDNLYTGRTELEVSAEIINELYSKKSIPLSKLDVAVHLYENEFLVLTNQCSSVQSALAWKKGDNLELICREKNFYKMLQINPKNVGQKFVIEALLAKAEEIPLVIIKGPAGGGKTYLAMAVLWYLLNKEEYKNFYITRSNTLPENEDLGFLPGDILEKMEPLLLPFYDNLEDIIGSRDTVRDKIEMEQIKVCPLAYIRGRSLPDSYIVIDEAQNITPAQMKTLVTRCGEKTKIIILGDIDQIDSSKMDKRNNGLVFVSERMKNSKLCAQVTFEKEEWSRSKLAMEAADLLS